MFNHLTFHNPWFLLGLVIVPLLLLWYIFNRKTRKPVLRFSALRFITGTQRTFKQRTYPVLFILRLLVLTFAIIALARPQSKLSREELNIEGVDIMLAIDVSGSMLAQDFKPDRLEAAKKVAEDFIKGRPHDRIGIIVFSGEAFTQCPLTIDHDVLLSLLHQLESGMIDDGTALGDGLATAVSRIKDSKAISKSIILLTDGINNAGVVDPLSAAEMAALYNIRLYTIGVGKKGFAPYPFKTPFGIQMENIEVKIDDDLLTRMAKLTSGGDYFRATDTKSLETIFKEIDKMEKSKIDVTQYDKVKEEFFPFLLIALICLVSEILLRQLYFRSLP